MPAAAQALGATAAAALNGKLAYDLPLPSSLPPSLLELNAQIPASCYLSDAALDFPSLSAFQKAANYLAAAQIYLRSNVLLHEKLDAKRDLKPRLLGHFGTCPGLIFAYAHISALIGRHEAKWMEEGSDDSLQRRFLFVTGPGHGAPAILACFYLEGSISHFYPEEAITQQGLQNFVKAFSWPNSVHPSHVNASTPGAIHEGGGECAALRTRWKEGI